MRTQLEELPQFSGKHQKGVWGRMTLPLVHSHRASRQTSVRFS
jgi:hypothetical protein